MGLQKSLSRKRNVSGSLGSVQRSIGYLQGGYKDATIHSKVQLFNTITQTGSIVYDTGYQRYYRPGISGNFAGYFSISDTVAYNKFNFITASAANSFSTIKHPSVTASDLNIYSQAWLLCSATPSYVTSVEEYIKLDLTTDTPVSFGNLSPNPHGTTRQGMSTNVAGFFINTTTTSVHVLNFTTGTVTAVTGPAILDSAIQYACGMSVSNSVGYFVGFSPRNVRVNVSGSSILSFVAATGYTYNFGESHSIVSDTSGYMMAGFSDTTGRYGTSQHGLCQKITFSNESITTLPDLALPQSSGQMMQGF